MQVLNQIQTVYNIPFPVSFVTLSSRLGIANLDLLAMVQFGCLGALDFYGRLVTMTVVPLALAAGLLAKHKYFAGGAQEAKAVKSQCVAWFLKLTYLVFPGVSTVVLQSYTCIDFDYKVDDERSFLKADLSISCDAPGRTGWVAYAVVMTLVYPIGITLLYAVLLWRQKHNICPIDYSSRTGISQWRCICGIPVLPNKLKSEKEEQAVIDKRKKQIESNQDLRNIQFLFRSMSLTTGGLRFSSASSA
jgi:hypothetical protein